MKKISTFNLKDTSVKDNLKNRKYLISNIYILTRIGKTDTGITKQIRLVYTIPMRNTRGRHDVKEGTALCVPLYMLDSSIKYYAYMYNRQKQITD